MRFNHVACFIEYANHSIVRAAVKLGVTDCMADCIWLAIPEATEQQRVAN